MIDPRGWQIRGLERFKEHREACFLVDATPGSGKTIFCAFCYRYMVETDSADFAVIVVPTTAIKGDADGGVLADWNRVGLQVTTVLKNKSARPSEFQAGVITYQQLPNMVGTLETWARNGLRILVIFDEIHHLTESNVWGAAAERLARFAVKVIGTTGTIFRGDGLRISFVRYSEDGKAIADITYSYREAVRDRVCRPVQFITDDGIAEFIREMEEEQVTLSEAKGDEKARDAASTIFRGDSPWLRTFVERADSSLEDYRAVDSDAGGLVVCRPGSDEEDERYLKQISRLVKIVTGVDAEVISHEDPDASARIERFRKSRDKWICAVRIISEGVDIKRLRVLVMATRPTTELLFRQLVGRVVRVEDPSKVEYAIVYIAKFPQLQEWASRIEKEAEAGLKDEPKSRDNKGENSEPTASTFIPLGSEHQLGGAIDDYGNYYSVAEYTTAENERLSDPELFDVPVTTIAYIRRKYGLPVNEQEPAQEPLQIQKKRLREQLVTIHRRLAYRRNPEEPDFGGLWLALFQRVGVRDLDDLVDNHGIAVMRQAVELLNQWMGGRDGTG